MMKKAIQFLKSLWTFPWIPPTDPLKLGWQGETAAVRHLRKAGLSVEGRRVKTPAGELDIVAREGSTWVFVEVKSRTGTPDDIDPTRLVRARQKRRWLRAAVWYMHARGLNNELYRLDLVVVTYKRERRSPIICWYTHIEG